MILAALLLAESRPVHADACMLNFACTQLPLNHYTKIWSHIRYIISKDQHRKYYTMHANYLWFNDTILNSNKHKRTYLNKTIFIDMSILPAKLLA